MTFETTRKQPTQEHFYIVEIDLPIVTGLCELTPGNEGYGTPLSCPLQDGTSGLSTKTYYFATNNAPVPLGISPVYRCITGINETATELKAGKGLAARGRATITFVDFEGLDPNPERASTAAIKKQGTFFGKYKARNIFENSNVRIKKYRKSPAINLATDAETTAYLAKSLSGVSGKNWQLQCADILSNVEFDQAQLPNTQSGSLRLDITDTATSIPVDQDTDWTQESRPYIVTIGDELLTVQSVSGNLTSSATLNVATRGVDIGAPDFSGLISKTRKSAHSAGDEVLINLTYDNVNIANVLEDMLLRSNIPSAYIPIADWLAEINLWHSANPNITTTFYESNSANSTILKILEPYMLDMWSDPVDGEIKLKAISQWQQASATIAEGKEIDFDSLTQRDKEDMRFSRAFIGYDKPYLTDNEDDSSYKKGSLSIRSDLEVPELYGKSKSKKFNNSFIIDKPIADLLVSRFTQRFGFTPSLYAWTTQERNLTFKTGDVVFIRSNDLQDISGTPSGNIRAQITKIQPVFTPFGREYKCEGLTYSSAVPADEPINIIGGSELNLYTVAGAPPTANTYTFILDGGQYGSTSTDIASIRAGGFPSGSKLIIICRNGADWQGKGGDGGGGEKGGICFAADGVDIDIYLSGADPESGTADGYLRAPGGGGASNESNEAPFTFGYGGGGAGINIGLGDSGAGDGTIDGQGGAGTTEGGSEGGDGGGWGEAGGAGSGDTGGDPGPAGKGIVKSGGVVRIFGTSPTRFINGIGDAPDP